MPVMIEALTRRNEETGQVGMVVEKVVPMEKVTLEYTEELHLHLFEGSNSKDDLNNLVELCGKHRGQTPVILCVSCLDDKFVFIEAGYQFRVMVTDELLKDIHEVLGEKRYRLKANDKVPEPRRKFKFHRKEAAATN
jgi:hypothetical protein